MQYQDSLILAEQHAIYDGVRRVSRVESDGGQSEAIIERAAVNVGDACRDHYVPESRAVIEGKLFNAQCSVADRDVRQACALGKGLVGDD